MTASVAEIDHALRALGESHGKLAAAAESARVLIDGLSAALQVRSVQLAAMLLPRAEDALLDDVARAFAKPELAAPAYRADFEKRARELAKTPRAVSPEQLRAAEDGRRRVEATASAIRADVMRIERDPDVVAALESRAHKGGGLRSMFGKPFAPRAPAKVRALGNIDVDAALAMLEKKRAELESVEEDARAAAAEVAQLRRAFVKAGDAEAALRALPGEMLTSARAAIATAIASLAFASLRSACARVDAVEVERIALGRAKLRYAAAAAAFCVDAPFVELQELLGDASRWRSGATDGGLPVPESEFVAQRTGEMLAKIDASLSRWESIRARLDGFVLSSAVSSREEPIWWDVIFDGSDDGSFVDEVRAARAQPQTAPKTGPIIAPFSNLEGEPESYDTGKWIEKFYGKPLEIDGFMTTSLTVDTPSSADTLVRAVAAAPRIDLAPRRRIGPYTLLHRLGSGGMADVHLATEAPGGERVVVKVIQPAHAQEPEYIAMFEREARIGLELRHENIVRTHDLVSVDGQKLLILEYVEGVSMQKLKQRVPVNVAALVAMDAAAGLAYAHERPVPGEAAGSAGAVPAGVIHRDVSPDNLLASVDGAVKLADFGIARNARDSTLTRTGELKGKLPYMAPELFEGEPASAASDVFALGVTLYWLLTGKRPFGGPTDGGTIHAIMASTAVPPGALVDGIPPEIDLLTVEMLAKQKSERPTALAVRDTLAPFATGARAVLAKLVREALV